MYSKTRFNTTSHGTGDVQINNVDGDLHIHNVYQMTPDQEHRVYEWLGAPDSSGNFHAAREKHHGNTGSWFLEGEEYVKWKETPDSTLWVYGTPGCGKTIICSTVIEKIRAEWAAESSFSSAYFFFDNRNAQTDLSLHDKFIRSIIKQLSHQSASFPAPLVDLYGGGQQQPSIQSLQLILEKIIDGFERTFIIIDAVDECTDREKTLAWIEQLTQRKKGNLQVLFSSRPEQDIIEKLRCMAYIARVTLNSKLADKDIETYIDVMLSKMLRWDAQTIARVKDALIIDSGGMHISELVDDHLQSFPKDLEGMYERALLNSPHQQDLKRFLIWLSFSFDPLEPEELADVVTVDLSSNGLPSYNKDLRYFGTADMLTTCSGFATEIEGDPKGYPPKTIRVIKLAHRSVTDYLVSDRIKAGPASYFSINAMFSHSLITKTCLAYVFYLRSFRSFDDSVMESFPLATYAARFWIQHMRLGGGEDQHLSQMTECIFSLDDTRAIATWVCLNDTDDSSTSSQIQRTSADIASPLYYACINCLTSVARDLLVRGADVNERGGYYGNALQAASHRGHDAIVRLLLDKGADVNAQGGRWGSALQAASFRGHDAIVRMLLEQGAKVLEYGAVHEEEAEQAKKRTQDGENERRDDDVGGTEIDGDDSSEGGGSEDEWASAQEDAADAADM
ncbi:ankyrin [Athelia psychrophila]|uniref:Ankyrin n=1 Tax=Athelia psychrophila TaxID=1759441 RepID=A0A166FTU2_9AGAM|nr:ankyrin [Fibularhizoctonia sp. CBS 109695]